jgi:hypothetical protein
MLMVTTPFLAMILMLLALWGVGGTASYTDLNSSVQQVGFSAREAKNYLVNDTKNHGLCSKGLENPEIGTEEKSTTIEKDSSSEKIRWDLVV